MDPIPQFLSNLLQILNICERSHWWNFCPIFFVLRKIWQIFRNFFRNLELQHFPRKSKKSTHPFVDFIQDGGFATLGWGVKERDHSVALVDWRVDLTSLYHRHDMLLGFLGRAQTRPETKHRTKFQKARIAGGRTFLNKRSKKFLSRKRGVQKFVNSANWNFRNFEQTFMFVQNCGHPALVLGTTGISHFTQIWTSFWVQKIWPRFAVQMTWTSFGIQKIW